MSTAHVGENDAQALPEGKTPGQSRGGREPLDPLPARVGKDPSRRAKWPFWIVITIAALYFLLPLVATFLFSLRGGKLGELSFAAYGRVFASPLFVKTFLFSLAMSGLTVVVGIALILPTTLWVHLRAPKARTLMETISLLPFVVPPIVLAFGLIRLYSHPPINIVSSPLLLVAAYVVLAFPYMYRSIDTGLRSIDVRRLTEAAQSLGASWLSIMFRVIVPNLKSALLAAVFLTFAIVIGELTLALMLNWPAFGPYMALVGRDLAYEPAALAIMSFGLTWFAIVLISFAGRRATRSK